MVVPTRSVRAGEVLGADDVKGVYRFPDEVPRTAVAPTEVVGRRATADLLRDEIIRTERLGPPVGGSVVDAGPPVPLRLPEDTVMVITAGRRIPVGAVVAPEDLFASQIGVTTLWDGVFLTHEHVVGRTVCQEILPQEFIRGERLAVADTAACGAARTAPR